MKKLFLLILSIALTTANSKGQTWEPLEADAAFTAKCFAEYNGELYVGFHYFLTHHLFSIVKLKDKKWENISTGVEGVSSHVNALAVYKDELYVAGRLQEVANIHEPAIMRWDGKKWKTVGPFISYVQNDFGCMAVYKDELYVGGGSIRFDASGKTAWNIAKWDGKKWTTVGGGLTGYVNAMVVFKGELYAGGSFMSTSAKTRAEVTWLNGIAKWDGQKWSPVGEFPSYINTKKVVSFGDPGYDYVKHLVVYKDELYAYGSFNNDKKKFSHCFQKWDGTKWVPIKFETSGDFVVNSITVYNDAMFFGGDFNKIDGKVIRNIAKWNGSEWSDCAGGVDAIVNKLYVYNDELLVTGIFDKAGGKEMKYMAKYKE